jgi:hypothetical protein
LYFRFATALFISNGLECPPPQESFRIAHPAILPAITGPQRKSSRQRVSNTIF